MSNETFKIDPNVANILFLDDMEDRHKSFINKYGMDDKLRIFQVRSAAEAIRWIDRFEKNGWRFDQVFLDHDLSLEDIMCPPGGPSKVPTGMDVVDRLCRLSFGDAPREAHVHSLNEPAAREMVRRLQGALIRSQWIPFYMLVA